MKITDSQLEYLLQSFRRIRPRAEFSRHSKLIILASPRSTHASLPTTQTVSWLSRALRVSAFAAAGIAVLIVSFYATQELSPLLLPGLNPQKITAEADMINSSVNIELSRIESFDQSAQESSSVLQKISQQNLNHLNETVVSDEAQLIDQTKATSSPADFTDDVNALIKELSK